MSEPDKTCVKEAARWRQELHIQMRHGQNQDACPARGNAETRRTKRANR